MFVISSTLKCSIDILQILDVKLAPQYMMRVVEGVPVKMAN